MENNQNDKHQEPTGKLSNQPEIEKSKKEFDPNKTTAQKDKQNSTVQSNQDSQDKTKVLIQKQNEESQENTNGNMQGSE